MFVCSSEKTHYASYSIVNKCNGQQQDNFIRYFVCQQDKISFEWKLCMYVYSQNYEKGKLFGLWTFAFNPIFLQRSSLCIWKIGMHVRPIYMLHVISYKAEQCWSKFIELNLYQFSFSLFLFLMRTLRLKKTNSLNLSALA